MTEEVKSVFSTQNGFVLTENQNNKNGPIPFKNHPQFSILVDILIRKYQHHAILHTQFSSRMIIPFLQALLAHVSHDHIPHYLRLATLVFIDADQARAFQKSIETDLSILANTLDRTEGYLLLAIRATDFHSSPLRKLLERLAAHPKCRLLILTNDLQSSAIDDYFISLTISKASETDTLAILRQQKIELENFHHILIPDELLVEVHQLAERYLSINEALEKSLLLLDSSAARAAVYEQANQHSTIKPALTSAAVLQVLANWTHIPATHLPLNTFHASEFTQALQQRMIGQDIAISLLAQKLQQAYARVQEIAGPFSTFLFAGGHYTGKKTMAILLAEQLFSHRDSLYIASLSNTSSSLLDLKLQRRSDSQFVPLKQILRQAPYSILFIESIEHASTNLLNELIDALSTGSLHDLDGSHYHLHQSLLLLSTNCGAERLSELVKPAAVEDKTSQLDLMQFIMQQQKQPGQAAHQELTPHEIAQELLQTLTKSLPAALCQRAHIIPFVSLNHDAMEKIIRLKLKLLGKQLDSRFSIDLGYAPEVIRFLAGEALKKDESGKQIGNIDSAIKQLYLSIEQTILEQEHNPNRPNQLFLQLNETGQVLRCHWLAGVTREHTT
jgi:ATP-dependent Clp protease ATP-binding subunit ClpA